MRLFDAPELFCAPTSVLSLAVTELNYHCREEGADIRVPSST
jgi:hypothetical protein